MPAATVAPPATPAPAGVTIVPAKPTKPIVGKGEIKLGQGSTTPDPAKVGTAREAMTQRLQKAAGIAPPLQETPGAKVPDPVPRPGFEPPNEPDPDETRETTPKSGTETPVVPGADEGSETAHADSAPASKSAADAKAKPWKLVEQYKGKVAELEKTLADIKSAGVPKEVQERITKAETRAKELEDEIRFVNYEKSAEFKSKYQEPYEKAWQRAVSEVSEITVAGADGQARAVNSQDILDLVNLPLGKARELANQLYGDFADDLMAHRKEIRTLYEQRTAALEEAKKTGSEREQQLRETQKKAFTEIETQVKSTWEKAQADALASETNGQFFKPVEGDEQWNGLLTKGYTLVDKAFATNPLDPKLTPEQRAEVVRLHNAVRNRAAAFGPMKYKINALTAKIAELTKELEAYSGSTPATGGGQLQPANGGPVDRFGAMRQKLQKLAR